MHILVTADTLGGVWTYTRELVTGLVLGRDRVTLVSFGDLPTDAQTRWMQNLPNLDYRPTAFKLEWMLDSEADMEASSRYLEAVIAESKPDLLHFSQYYYGALECDLPRVVVAHSDVVSWWLAVHGEEPPRSDWCAWYRHTVTAGLEGADAVVAPSRWMLTQIQKHYAQPARFAVVYNGRTPHHFNSHADKDDRLVSIGRLWDQAKQISLLAESGLKCPMTIAGAIESPEGHQSGSQPAFGKSIELRERLGSSQVRSLLASASIYAATSRYEPFGLAALEAALSRCALVVNDIPSFRELWGPTALYFPANDPKGLRDAVMRLRADPGLRRHYSELAYQRARRLFSAETMVEEYLALYRSLVQERSMAA